MPYCQFPSVAGYMMKFCVLFDSVQISMEIVFVDDGAFL